VVVAAIGALATGCVRADAEFSFNKDDTYSAEVFVGMNRAVLRGYVDPSRVFEQDADQMAIELELVGKRLGGDSGNYRLEPTKRDKYEGQMVTVEGAALADWPVEIGPAELAVAHEGGWFKVAGNVDLAAMTPALESFEEADDPEFSLKLEFPGKVYSANGEIAENTVTFKLKPGEDNRVEAIAADASPGPRLWTALSAAVAAGLAALVAGLLVMRRGRRAKGSPPQPGTMPPGQAPMPGEASPSGQAPVPGQAAPSAEAPGAPSPDGFPTQPNERQAPNE
jgi:hypothetical protein